MLCQTESFMVNNGPSSSNGRGLTREINIVSDAINHLWPYNNDAKWTKMTFTRFRKKNFIYPLFNNLTKYEWSQRGNILFKNYILILYHWNYKMYEMKEENLNFRTTKIRWNELLELKVSNEECFIWEKFRNWLTGGWKLNPRLKMHHLTIASSQ